MNTKKILKKFNYFFHKFSIIILILGIFLIFINFPFVQDKNSLIYSYNIKKETPYKVFLSKNDFYDKDVLESGLYYLENSIDKYHINFKYSFKGNKNGIVNYHYQITSILIGTINDNQEDKKIWEKSFLLKDKSFKVNNNSFTINELVEINYNYYKELVEDYEKNYGIIIDASLHLKLDVDANIKIKNFVKDLKIKDTEELIITLDNISYIDENYEPNINKDIEEEKDKNFSNINYFLGSILIIISLISNYFSIKEKDIKEKKYQRKVNFILKNYHNLIVTVQEKPNLKNLISFKLNSLEDLVNVAYQNNTNIIFCEIIPNRKSNLYVIVNNYLYLYSINFDN